MELHELRRLRKRRPFPIPASACRIIGDLGGDTEQVGQVRFALTRSNGRAQIMFCVATGSGNTFSWNVTSLLGLEHETFAEARRWAHAYAAGYGHLIEEVVKPRKQRVTGEDGKALRVGRCKEAWLSSAVPDLWAEAMVRCKHPGGYCGEDGYCHYRDCDMEMSDPLPRPVDR